MESFIPAKFARAHCPCGFTSLHIAATHGYHSFAELLIWLIWAVTYILATDSEGMTALHYVVKDVVFVCSEYFVDLYVDYPKGWIENQGGASQCQETIANRLDLQYPWLNALVKLIESLARSKRARETSILQKKDKRNHTVFDKLEKITSTSLLLTGSSRTSGSLLHGTIHSMKTEIYEK